MSSYVVLERVSGKENTILIKTVRSNNKHIGCLLNLHLFSPPLTEDLHFCGSRRRLSLPSLLKFSCVSLSYTLQKFLKYFYT